MENQPPKLGLIAGGGNLPKILVRELQEKRDVFVIALIGDCEPETIENIPHEWVNIAAVGKALNILKGNNITEVVLAGSVKRPALSSLRPDFAGAKFLAKFLARKSQGDNAILSAIINYLEECGLRVAGAHELLGNLLVGVGALGKIKPDARVKKDIELATRTLREIGKLDIGQAAIAQNGRIIGIEAVEGTDELIKRCAPYLRQDKGGVLVKIRKPGQDLRADLPTIGVGTVENIAAAGMAGIALEARSALVLDKAEAIESANRHGVFIFGIKQ